MKAGLILSFISGLLFACWTMSIAWSHNSQCEIHCGDTIFWGYWLLIGGFWFVVGSLPGFVVVLGAYLKARTMGARQSL